MQNITRRSVIWGIIMILISILPLTMQFTDEVRWNEAVTYGAILLVVGGAYELWRWLKTRDRTYRIAFVIGLAGIVLLGWVSGAVGIIGSENNPANLMYWAIPAVVIIGTLMVRFKPRGMARTLFMAAIAQISVPVAALIISPEVSWGNAGVIGVFVFNAIFAGFFIVSALLFRLAPRDNSELKR